jgi:mannose/cellobiose epimerase-like protein (N-acyl-D-glucosamine 2-epimerase family)
MSAFLMRSHQAVVQHCRALLATANLAKEQEQRLDRLLREAEAALEHLVQRKAA